MHAHALMNESLHLCDCSSSAAKRHLRGLAPKDATERPAARARANLAEVAHVLLRLAMLLHELDRDSLRRVAPASFEHPAKRALPDLLREVVLVHAGADAFCTNLL